MRLMQKGYTLEICRPALGCRLPENLEQYAGTMIFGGPMSANDNEDYIKYEIDWISRPLRARVPYLGICLGGQMLAKQLGGRVYGFPDDHAEIGYYPIEPTSEGRKYGLWPEKVYQWHREGFDQIKGSISLATSCGKFPEQAFRYGDTAFAIQFHPEVTQWMMHRWLAKAEHRLVLPGAKPRESHFEDRYVHDRYVDSWLDHFLDLWLGSANSSPIGLAAE